MGCCGRTATPRRSASHARATETTSGPDRPAQSTSVVPTAGAGVHLRWRRRVTATVTGPVTGDPYRVSADQPLVRVDRRDARGLLKTGFFHLTGP